MVKRRLYLEAGHGGKDPGAIGVGGIKEAGLTLELRNGITAALRRLNYRGTIIHDPDDAALAGAIAAFKPNPEDILVGLHFNAGGNTSTGVETIVSNTPSATSLLVARALSEAVSNALGIRQRVGHGGKGIRYWRETPRGLRGVDSGWLRIGGHAVILEVCFITNPVELATYQSKKAEVFEAVAKALISLLN